MADVYHMAPTVRTSLQGYNSVFRYFCGYATVRKACIALNFRQKLPHNLISPFLLKISCVTQSTRFTWV